MGIKKKIYEDFKHDFRLSYENIEDIQKDINENWFGSLIVFFLSLIGFSVLAVVTIYYRFIFLARLWVR